MNFIWNWEAEQAGSKFKKGFIDGNSCNFILVASLIANVLQVQKQISKPVCNISLLVPSNDSMENLQTCTLLYLHAEDVF